MGLLQKLYRAGILLSSILAFSSGCLSFSPPAAGTSPSTKPEPSTTNPPPSTDKAKHPQGATQTGYVEPEKPPQPEKNRPTVSGSQLNLKPDETVVERALELTEKIKTADEDKRKCTERIRQLESSVAERERALKAAEAEIHSATDEIKKSQEEMTKWKQQVVLLREKLAGAEKENLDTLQSIVSILEQMLEQDKRPPEESKEVQEGDPPKADMPKRNPDSP